MCVTLTLFPSTVSLFHILSVDTLEVFRGDYHCQLIQLFGILSYPKHKCIHKNTHITAQPLTTVKLIITKFIYWDLQQSGIFSTCFSVWLGIISNQLVTFTYILYSVYCCAMSISAVIQFCIDVYQLIDCREKTKPTNQHLKSKCYQIQLQQQK